MIMNACVQWNPIYMYGWAHVPVPTDWSHKVELIEQN